LTDLPLPSRCKAYSPTETVKAREGKITEAPVIEFTADSSPFATITCDFDVDDMPALRTHYKEVRAPAVCRVVLLVM
jgi:hypothetical protein